MLINRQTNWWTKPSITPTKATSPVTTSQTKQTLREINLRIKSIYTLQGTSQVNKTILRKITTQFKEPIIVKQGWKPCKTRLKMYNMEIITSGKNEVAAKNTQKLNLYWMICQPDTTMMSNHKERNNSHRETKETQAATANRWKNKESITQLHQERQPRTFRKPEMGPWGRHQGTENSQKTGLTRQKGCSLEQHRRANALTRDWSRRKAKKKMHRTSCKKLNTRCRIEKMHRKGAEQYKPAGKPIQ